MRNRSKIDLFLIALAATVVAVSGCSSLKLHGRVKDAVNSDETVYIAPKGIFSCPIPYSRLGHPVQIQDSIEKEKGSIRGGTLRFISWVGVYRVDYLAVSDLPSHDAINKMLDLQLDWYRNIPSPKAFVLRKEFYGEGLFAILVAPEGQRDITNGAGKHLDLCRTMSIFREGDYIYAISADANDSLETKLNDESPERINRLHKQIDEFAASLKFGSSQR
jgi:hypothetical protein